MLFNKLENKPSHSKINWEHQLTTMKKHTNKSDYLKVRQKIEELCCIEAHHLKKVKQNIYG